MKNTQSLQTVTLHPYDFISAHRSENTDIENSKIAVIWTFISVNYFLMVPLCSNQIFEKKSTKSDAVKLSQLQRFT